MNEKRQEAILRIPAPLQRALALYFDMILKCRFVLDGERVASGEVFHETGFLPLVADAADRRSRDYFGSGIAVSIEADDAGLIGRRVVLPESVDQALLLKLVHAAELVFGAELEREIDLTPIYEYCWSPDAANHQPDVWAASRQRL
ncbi:hypothetical protein AB4Y43_16885 [Paraburkholderia sp. BR10872]|uniref:hypothetical protein n=1 Tax=Paraburkholderia sp. BR10872 TaxID=3236989 RepID=UPI0034D1C3A6